jgi:hypothetical protein
LSCPSCRNRAFLCHTFPFFLRQSEALLVRRLLLLDLKSHVRFWTVLTLNLRVDLRLLPAQSVPPSSPCTF